MNDVLLRGTPRGRRLRQRGGLVVALLSLVMWAGSSSNAAEKPAAAPVPAVEPTAAAEKTAPDEDKPAAADEANEGEDVISMAAYNVKADRIEDFGLRVRSRMISGDGKANIATIWFKKFAPVVSEIVPYTAAAKAGLRPGERILKSEGQSTVGGPFSTGKFGQWYKTQKRKWADVAAGKKNVTWTLEVENLTTNTVRTVKLVVPTPPPYWGSSVWHAPEGRTPAVVSEPGPLAERARTILDNGIWTLIGANTFARPGQKEVPPFPPGQEPVGFKWQLGARGQGEHAIYVTQFRGRTDVIFETSSRVTGRWVYLTSPSGVLERAWHWQYKPKHLGETTLEEARESFAAEVDFWTTKVEKVSARWPFEVKPGYDANAIFATLAAKDGVPVPEKERPLSPEFLKLRPATEAEQALFTEAYGKIGADADKWAYTETSHSIDDQRVTVTRVDPSKPEGERCVLVSIDGKTPTPDEEQRWRVDGGDQPKPLGEMPPLTNLVEAKDLRVFKEEAGAIVFELPVRGGSSDFPAEKVQALFAVNKTSRAFEYITVKLRDSIRVAGVVKITEAGLEMRWETFDSALAPQPVKLRVGGGARVLFVKIARSFEAVRTDYRRVVPFDESLLLPK